MKLYGLIGKSLAHSFSKNYFTEKFLKENITDCSYELFELDDIKNFHSIIKNNPTVKGLNVTIPYKDEVLEYLTEIDGIAKEIGAVNTISITKDLKLIGHNTDYYGFKKSLKPFLDINHSRALILGTGGASKAVHYVLKELNIDCLFVSRNPKNNNEISYNEINDYVLKHHQIIINTTPVGMYPNVSDSPMLNYDCITPEHLLYDLIYNPTETAFLQKGKEQGCITLNGLEMLKLQAEKSWEIWNT
jgi:shikimate dehydrogenase